MSTLTAIYERFAQAAVTLTAAVIDLLIIFGVIDWSAEQVGAVNLVALLVWGVIFGQQVNTLRDAGGA